MRAPLTRLTLCFSLVWLLNELGTNVVAYLGRFGKAKVLKSLTDDLGAVYFDIGMQLLWMLALTGVLIVLASWAWCAVVQRTWLALRAGRTFPRGALWIYAAATSFAFFNLWYSAHAYLFPYSRMNGSPLSAFCGSVRWLDTPSLASRGVLLFSVPVVVLACSVALRRSRALRRGVFAALLLGVAAVQAGKAVHRVGPSRPFTADGSVVLLGVDSLQVNRLAAGGHPTPRAPALDGFLEQARLFDNVWTPLARTYPSWITLLSGRHPVNHGMRFNLLPDSFLDPDNSYLPQHYAAAGYNTLHATDEVRFSILRPEFGFDELLHPHMGAEDFLIGSFFDFSLANLVRQTHTGNDLYPALANNRAAVAYNPKLFVHELIERLDALPRDEPAFVNVHLCGNHWPFRTSAPWAHASDDPVMNSIAMTDAQVGELLHWMDANELSPRATTVLLSDHGDGWSGDADDDTNFHGDTVEDATSNKIFLAFRGARVKPGRQHELLRAEDLAPTLLELSGLPVEGVPFDGESFLPALSGAPLSPRDVFAESGLEARVYSVKQLVERSVDWYQIDPDSSLVHLRADSFEEFLPLKSYTLIDGDVRLVATPHLRKIEAHAFDPVGGEDLDEAAQLTPAAKRALIQRLAERYDLDHESLLDAAAFRGFLAKQTVGIVPARRR
ncbi:MAG: sulfatase [Planctomycetota bacterium]|nr:MAG: sulfatase [Planctomycetota bacterium]